MGEWNISIDGHGIHDNALETDADAMATEFAAKLRAVGHEVHRVIFTVGTQRDLAPEQAPAEV